MRRYGCVEMPTFSSLCSLVGCLRWQRSTSKMHPGRKEVTLLSRSTVMAWAKSSALVLDSTTFAPLALDASPAPQSSKQLHAYTLLIQSDSGPKQNEPRLLAGANSESIRRQTPYRSRRYIRSLLSSRICIPLPPECDGFAALLDDANAPTFAIPLPA